MGDLGSDVGSATLNMGTKAVEMGTNLMKALLSLFKSNYDQKLAKEKYQQAKLDKTVDGRRGYTKLNNLVNSKYDLTYAKAEMSKEQLQTFLQLAKKRGVPVSFVRNSKITDKNKTYLAVYRTIDADRIKDITEQLIRDCKIENIEQFMKDQFHYDKTDFEGAIKRVDGKITEQAKFICNRENPVNYIKVTGSQEVDEKGKEYVASHYEVYNNGVKQKSKEFKHGEFIHNCDGEGKNSSDKGVEHWINMKSEMKIKGEMGDDLLVFDNEADYKDYIEKFNNDREKANEESKCYDDLKKEKEDIIKDDVKKYNEKQANSLFSDISGVAKNNTMEFDDTIDRFQVGKWEKEEPYIICERTDPNNYMEVVAEKTKDYKGRVYNAHTYNIYVDDKKVENPLREDGKWTDVRYKNRPADEWKNLKSEMKKAGKFSDDCIVFANKEDYLKYREIYQREHSNIKDPTIHFETNTEGLRKDFGYIQNYLESCKEEIKNYNDLGSFVNGTFEVKTDESLNLDVNFLKKNELRINEGIVISKQISNYKEILEKGNELIIEKSKLEALKNSDNKELLGDIIKEQEDKIQLKIEAIKELQEKEEVLWKEREQLTGIKAENIRNRYNNNEEKEVDVEEKRMFSKEELKEFATRFKEENSFKEEKTFEKTTEKAKFNRDKER